MIYIKILYNNRINLFWNIFAVKILNFKYFFINPLWFLIYKKKKNVTKISLIVFIVFFLNKLLKVILFILLLFFIQIAQETCWAQLLLLLLLLFYRILNRLWLLLLLLLRIFNRFRLILCSLIYNRRGALLKYNLWWLYFWTIGLSLINFRNFICLLNRLIIIQI